MSRLPACLMVAAVICGTAHAADTPKFKDYPARIYSGMQAPLRLDTPQAQQFRTRLRAAANDDINFGGRYVFTQWGAGTGCDTGALIDIKTGDVHFLPFAACNWQGFERPFEVKPNSRLMVVAGQVGETGLSGAHFFEFTGKEFKLVGSNVASSTSVGPAAGPAEAVSRTVNKEELWKRNWETANRRPFDFVLLCYSATADTLKAKLIKGLGDKFEAHFVLAGGNAENAELAIGLCDRDIRKLGYFNDESAYTDASRAFRTMAAIMDLDMLATCESKECKDVAKVVFEKGE